MVETGLNCTSAAMRAGSELLAFFRCEPGDYFRAGLFSMRARRVFPHREQSSSPSGPISSSCPPPALADDTRRSRDLIVDPRPRRRSLPSGPSPVMGRSKGSGCKVRSIRRSGGFSSERLAVPQEGQEVDLPSEDYEPIEITPSDLRNHFFVTVFFPEVADVSTNASEHTVRGRETAGELAERIAYELWKDDKVLSSATALDLYENDVLVLPTTLLAQILKNCKREKRGDGISVQFLCIIRGVWGGDYFKEIDG